MQLKETLEEALIKLEKLEDRFVADTKCRLQKFFEKITSSDVFLFKKNGLSLIDAVFSALYIKACDRVCEKSERGLFSHPHGWNKTAFSKPLNLLHTLSRPLSRLSRTARADLRRERAGVFSDSSLRIVSATLSAFKKHASAVLVILLVAVLGTLVYQNSADPVLEVSVNGVSVGTVRDATVVEKALRRAEGRVTAVTGKCYDIPCEISYTPTLKSVSLDEGEVYNILNSYTLSETCEAYGLFVDGELIATLKNRSDIMFAFDTLEARHLALTGEKAQIANRVEVRYQEYASDSIISRTALMDMLSETNSEKLLETPTRLLSSSGESAVLDAAVANTPSITDTIGENLTSSLSSRENTSAITISYEVVTLETVREYVPFETRYVEDDSLYIGQERISTFGHKGMANVTYSVSSIDGEEISRTLHSTAMIYDPVCQVVRVGTREYPENMSEDNNGGKFMILPVINPRITDRYGWRDLYGRNDFHYGLDLAANYGTSIYAAASGEVVYAQYHSDFGWCIKIEHENGIISLYAHCSKLLVKEGDAVRQGDIIAEVGSTGYSYGNHCHMEVIVNGERVDPEDYIYVD